eukprot:TRINITY_DN9335_c0_g1_i5.p1 TRINITY_DN9335_c0_g1~~TRINITY_DN9335_c0_g1_i5.p1  ORF type:complete len:132 (-),score=21.13 TRINITY_DN9335_c0_g1_i5:522-917(-)
MGPAFYVDIDCDLYTSAYAALDFLFANQIAQVGTIIGYDDWWTLPCRFFHKKNNEGKRMKRQVSPLDVGEGLAHATIAEKYGVKFRCLAGPCKPVKSMKKCNMNNNWAPVFVVESISGEKSGHVQFSFPSA